MKMDERTYRSLVTAQVNIAESLKGIKDNLKLLNDANILHHTQQECEHKVFLDMIKVMVEKYWYLILALIAALVIITGYEHVAGLFV